MIWFRDLQEKKAIRKKHPIKKGRQYRKSRKSCHRVRRPHPLSINSLKLNFEIDNVFSMEKINKRSHNKI